MIPCHLDNSNKYNLIYNDNNFERAVKIIVARTPVSAEYQSE